MSIMASPGPKIKEKNEAESVKQSKLSSLENYTKSFLRRYISYVITLFFIAIVAGIFEIEVDYKIKEIIDLMVADHKNDVGHLIILFIFYKLMVHLSYFFWRLLEIKYKPMIIEEVVSDIYNKVGKHSLHWFDSRLSGEISSKISDFQVGISAIITQLFVFFKIIITFAISIYFLVKVSIWPTLVLGIFAIIHTPVIYFLMRKQMVLQEKCTVARQKVMGLINDSIINIFGIKVIGDFYKEFSSRILPGIKKWRECDRETRQYDAYYVDNIDTVMVTLMSAVQIYLLVYLYQSGEISAGGFAFVMMMTIKVHDQLDNFLDRLLFDINPNIAQIRSSYHFINTKIDVVDHADAKSLDAAGVGIKGGIEYRNVNFSYGINAKLVLHNLDLKINPGEKLGIVGLSGAGKTTMVKCLLRYFDLSDGKIFIDGQDISQLQQDSLRRAISVIPQDITMFHRSIADNLRLANPEASIEELIAACKKARIHDDIASMPDGYDTIVGERGVKLSGGQRQRIAIARAVLKNAPILILDEATSSLDTQTEALIQDSISEVIVGSKITVIAIAHRLSTLRHMERIVVVDRGKVVEDGSHEELMARKGIYHSLWEAQLGGFITD